jgi:hypothetical protein
MYYSMPKHMIKSLLNTKIVFGRYVHSLSARENYSLCVSNKSDHKSSGYITIKHFYSLPSMKRDFKKKSVVVLFDAIQGCILNVTRQAGLCDSMKPFSRVNLVINPIEFIK